MTAFEMMQIAMAVFIGNLLTFAVVKGAQVLDRDGGPAWKYFAYAVPLAMVALALIGSTG